MSRIFPTRDERQQWGPLEWVTYVGGTIGILSAIAAGANWIWGWAMPRQDPPVIADSGIPGAQPAPTGRLGIVFVQGGADVAIARIPDEAAKPFFYAYDVALEPGPFQMRLPRRYCDGTVDTATAGVTARIIPVGRLAGLVNRSQGPEGREFRTFFASGDGFAGPHFAQTNLMFEDPPPWEGFTGFNFFDEQRFTKVDTNQVTITVNTVTNLSSEQDFLKVGTPFPLLVGVEDAQCQPTSAPGIELLRVGFRQD